MAVSSAFLPRPALLVCACLVLAPLARAAAPVPETAPAPVAVPWAPEAPLAAAPTPAPSLDASEPGLDSAAEAPPESLGWMLARTLFLFGGVLAAIYLTLNVGLRKLMGLQGVGPRRQTLVSVVERVALDQRQMLFVLKAADEYLLVGGGEKGLQLLSKLDTDAVERLRSATPAPTPVALSPFLQKLLARRDATARGLSQPSGSPPPGA